MNRIDGPGIAGDVWPENPRFVCGDAWAFTPDANHSTKSNSSPTPETGEATEEPTYGELAAAFYKKPGNWHTGMLAVYRLGVAHGENKVCKRLPRLWGFWYYGWGKPFATTKRFVSEECAVHENHPSVREFDPMTGGPKA